MCVQNTQFNVMIECIINVFIDVCPLGDRCTLVCGDPKELPLTCIKDMVDLLVVRVEAVDKFVVFWCKYLPRLKPDGYPWGVGCRGHGYTV